MNKRCSCLAMAEVRRRYPEYLPPIEMADKLDGEAPVTKPGALENEIFNMVTMAGHYKNWEKALGTKGIALVLGNMEAESS